MAVEIKSETVDVQGRSVLLVSVKNGENAIGTCTAGMAARSGLAAAATLRLFYIGNDPIVNMACPNFGNKQSDKLVSLCPGLQGFSSDIYEAFGTCFSRLNQGDTLLVSLREIFGMLQDGVYTAYYADYYPTDGNGVFFWGGYNLSHEVRGTAEYGRSVAGHVFKPCYLIPSQPMDFFQPRVKSQTDEQVKRRRVQGIVYHLSGFHSVLLKGHHGSVSCVEKDVPFKVAVIEKICEPYTDKFTVQAVKAPEPEPETRGEGETPENPAAETAEKPAPNVHIVEREGITGFRSASVKVPLELFPADMLRQIIAGRHEFKPAHFNTLMAKLGVVRRKTVSNNILPLPVLEKAEAMPDVSMVESAFALTSLSDEQLSCLLRGDVECNGEIIVSPNFYSSIVTACNFLQFTDVERFVNFSIAIMDNPELAATHEYVARRVSSQEQNPKLYRFFKEALDGGDSKYDRIAPAAQSFVKRYAARN